ncbi:MAG: LysR family transcriptional regulator [Labilithrix sp.]|nr:LysR family transcriptional regulator [Labilithrix sp.]MCW5811492.1 LysR family transcriptional regulator [Labilithrix sp.]
MGAAAQEDLNDVQLFVRVVKAESFTAAAKEQGLPISTVSRRVARLEEKLGTRLLERTTRSLRLSETGRTYFTHAERALEELARGSRQVRERHVVPRGKVRLTCTAALGPAVTRALAPYLVAQPLVTVEIDVTDRRVDLSLRGIDVAVRAGDVGAPDYVARKLVESPRHLFASPAYLARKGRPEEVADLEAHDLVGAGTSGASAVWELWSGERRRRFAFAPRLYVTDFTSAKQAVLAGVGIGLLPSRTCAEHVRSGELVRVLPAVAGPTGAVWLVYRSRRTATAAVRSCAEHLLTTLRFDPNA